MFDERKAEAKRLVVGFLDEYSPPRGLDSRSLASRIERVADAFARRMPTDGVFSEKVQSVLDRVRDTHLSNTWPTQPVFIMAMPDTEFRGAAPKTYKSEDPNRIARLMSQGLAVPEIEIWRSHDVSRDVLDRYRFAAVENWRNAYRGEARRLMAEKYGGCVHSYFQEAAE